MIPILTSFLLNKNSVISTKSSELISFLKDKVISEIFEFENVKEEMDEFLENETHTEIEEDFLEKLFKDTDRCSSSMSIKHEESLVIQNEKSVSRFRRNTRNTSILEEDTNFDNLWLLVVLTQFF